MTTCIPPLSKTPLSTAPHTTSPHTTPPIKAFLFDCDGTLVDSEVIGNRALHDIGLRFGARINYDTFYQATYGRNMASVIETLNANSPSPMPPAYMDLARAHQAEVFKAELTEIEGAKALLETLTAKNIPFAIVTNGPLEKAQLTLGLTGMLGLVGTERIYSAYEKNTFKPDPELFLMAARDLGVAPASCAAVEDSPSGLRAGVAAGMQVFSLLPKDKLPEDLLAAPINCIEKLDDLRALFQ